MISFPCPKCALPLEAPEVKGGESFTCPDCGQSVVVPMPIHLPVGALDPPRSRRRSSNAWAWGIVIGATFLGCLGCGGLFYYIGLAASTWKPVVSKSGRVQVSVPGTWTTQTDLNDEADLQVANRFSEGYLIVISDPKIDFVPEFTLQDFADLTVKTMVERLDRGRIASGPTPTTINGRPAIRHEIHGFSNRVNVVFYHASVEGKDTYHQVLAWTLRSQEDNQKPVLEQALASFMEIGKGN